MKKRTRLVTLTADIMTLRANGRELSATHASAPSLCHL